MAQAERRRSLGRGLSALIPPHPASGTPTASTPSATGLKTLSLDEVLPSDSQPRQVFREDALEELAESIREHGVLQPIVVRKRAAREYEIVAGERRWRAARKAGLKTISAVVTDLVPEDTLTVALVENIQREDLNPIEEAEAYHRLTRDLGYSQAQVAKAVGKDRATIANALRLLKLPEAARHQVLDGELTMGHARALLSLGDDREIIRFGREVAKKGLSVRETERAVAGRKNGSAPSKSARKTTANETAAERDLRQRLQRALGTKVELKHKNGRGTITVHFASSAELERIVEQLGV